LQKAGAKCSRAYAGAHWKGHFKMPTLQDGDYDYPPLDSQVFCVD